VRRALGALPDAQRDAVVLVEWLGMTDAEAGRVRGPAEALDSVLRRADRRRRTRRIASGAVALAVAGAAFGLAYEAFGPGREARPASTPLPGPTATPTPSSDQASPPPLELHVTADPPLAGYVIALLEGQGDIVRAGGYSVGAEPTNGGARTETTTLFCHPNLEAEARRLRDAFFPGAELRTSLDQTSIGVVIGEDFARREAEEIANYVLVEQFMTARGRGSGAETFLSIDATRQYERQEGGLSLYSYVSGSDSLIAAVLPGDGDGSTIIVRFLTASGGYTETITVGDADSVDGTPEILAAELNEVPSTAAGTPAVEEVRAFVRQFLEARRRASGAGTFLGEDARAAYAAGEDGLDLLGYAEDAIDAHITKYDKLSPRRHRVVVRFTLGTADGSPETVWETLLIGWRSGDVFVVLNAERGVPS
jgi:hypothetical protein